MTTGDKIRNIRVLRGYSQESMADGLGISDLTYGDIERNKTKVTLSRLEQIAEKLGVSVASILEFEDRITEILNGPVASGTSENTISSSSPLALRTLLYRKEILELEVEKLRMENQKLELEAKYAPDKNI